MIGVLTLLLVSSPCPDGDGLVCPSPSPHRVILSEGHSPELKDLCPAQRQLEAGALLCNSEILRLASDTELATPDEQNVLDAAHAALGDIWPDAEVQVVRLSTEAAAAQPPLRVRFLDEVPRGRASAEVETRAGDAWVSAGWAYLDVTVYDTALVLTRDVGRGDALADAVQRQRVEVTSVSGSPLSPSTALEGWSAARSLRAGTILTARLADAPSAVENRAPLRVRYTRGALSVTLTCEARERGAIGDTIRAACSDPRATYHVRLTAPGEGVWMRTL